MDYAILSQENSVNVLDILKNLWESSRIYDIFSDFLGTGWQTLVMVIIACVLLYLAIGKKFEPLLLVPIATGMLLANIGGGEIFNSACFADGHVHWEAFNGVGMAMEDGTIVKAGLFDYLYLGVKLGIYPCLIFMGVGAMTDFSP